MKYEFLGEIVFLKLIGKFCLAIWKFAQRKEIGRKKILFFLPVSPKKGKQVPALDEGQAESQC